jgi:hypothetical protein
MPRKVQIAVTLFFRISYGNLKVVRYTAVKGIGDTSQILTQYKVRCTGRLCACASQSPFSSTTLRPFTYNWHPAGIGPRHLPTNAIQVGVRYILYPMVGVLGIFYILWLRSVIHVVSLENEILTSS